MSESGAIDKLALTQEGKQVILKPCKQIPIRLPAERYPPANAIALHQAVVAANDDGTEANLGCHIQDSIAVGLQVGRVAQSSSWCVV